MLNIVIVEDYEILRESLVEAMVAAGHHVAAFDSAEAFWSGCGLGTVDVMILDLNLPGEDGITTSRRVRSKFPDIGIVMLTARGEPDERRIGYEAGADIYLSKPSSLVELTAAIGSIARRLEQRVIRNKTLVFDAVELTISGCLASVSLSAFESNLLMEFTRALDGKLGIDCIADLLGNEGDVSKAAIEVRILRLRKKMIAAGASGQPIKAVRNQGYKLTVRMNVL